MRAVGVACRSIGLLIVASGLCFAQSAPTRPHPLDPLTKQEVIAAIETLRAGGMTTDASRYPLIALHEPPKDILLAPAADRTVAREAFVIVYERASARTFEAIVDLGSRTIRSWKEVPGVQPSFMLEDLRILQDVVRADPRWQDAMRKRGIQDFDRVQIDPWTAGSFGFADEVSRRIFRGVSLYRGTAINAYARPIEGVVAYVDVDARKVIKLVDSGVVPVATRTAEYDATSARPLREPPKPLTVSQPLGPGFEISGHEVRWQNWRFRYGMHPREGLVLYTVGYESAGRLRSILHRASLSEMVVPYGDPGPSWFFRNAFDEGEYGIGRMANSLEPLTDAPPNATFLDAVFSDESGVPVEVPRAAALFERDGGLLWKHFDMDSQRNESRRARELVLSWIATVGNYEYGFNWVFHQDGTLEMEMLLSGIMQTKGVAASSAEHGSSDHAHLVAPGVAAVHHQHFFNFRLDMDVEGQANDVVEIDTAAAPPGPDNPYMNAISTITRPLTTEQEAARHVDLAANRRWKVMNRERRNELGQPAGYLLDPGDNALPYADPQSSVRRRAGFLSAHLWVTPYNADERYAAGDYINQSAGNEGLPKWTAANRSIANRDVVLWYTMGITHIPRPEDWPVMPVHRTGFQLVPNGFFDRNPALDVPAAVTAQPSAAQQAQAPPE